MGLYALWGPQTDSALLPLLGTATETRSARVGVKVGLLEVRNSGSVWKENRST